MVKSISRQGKLIMEISQWKNQSSWLVEFGSVIPHTSETF
jgi:hypothetical protein